MPKNQAYELEVMMKENLKNIKNNTKFIAVTSGKGGVGKSSISANLSYLLSLQGKNVAVFDADIGLANLDLIFGIKTKYNILHALKGEVEFKDVIYDVDKNLRLIPGDSGEEILKYANTTLLEQVLEQSDVLNDLEYMIIDTGAGIGGITQSFLDASDKVIVVTMPDPAAIADAYATIKLNAKKDKEMLILFNMVKNETEAKGLYHKISDIGQKHIKNLKLEYLGYIPNHSVVKEATRNRELFSKTQRVSPPSIALNNIAKNLLKNMEQNVLFTNETKNFRIFLQRILSYM